jgi:hypothetical protein
MHRVCVFSDGQKNGKPSKFSGYITWQLWNTRKYNISNNQATTLSRDLRKAVSRHNNMLMDS